MDRFSRNILIEGIGKAGQQKLKNANVLIIGAGGLGSPVLFYLAAAGIGHLGIMDYDQVDMTNLQRQILHQTCDLGRSKVVSATEKLKALYPELIIQGYEYRLTAENAEEIIRPYDFVVECCDNYDAKFLINDTCVRTGTPFSHGAVLSMQGEVSTYLPGNACYRCIFGEAPAKGTMPTSAEVGILGSIAGIAGSIQATEVIKYITGTGTLLTNRLLVFNGRTMQFTNLKTEKNSTCLCCQ
ncbi:MAG: HesA/MoeB/ThiF family protein [Tannerellaceae bacterium]|nr:HesA/MoeB/ThiF family protein [Tannerellaceae bacterium]